MKNYMFSSDKLSNKKILFQKYLFYIMAFAVMYIVVYPIFPLNDDWHYLTSPNKNFQFIDLLPTATFWRPFDALFGAVVGLIPSFFPEINRFFVVLAHVLNAALLGSIMSRLGISTTWRRIGICFFLFSSSIWAVVASPDALNQAYSVFWGLLALFIHFKKGGYYYLPMCFIATLCKESGVSWFFVIPVFDVILHGQSWSDFYRNKKRVILFVNQVSYSLFVICIYFIIRFWLYGSITLGSDSSTYKLSVFSFSTLKNAILLFSSAATGIDSVAMFGTNKLWVWFGITVIFSLLFLIVLLKKVIHLVIENKYLFQSFCILLCVLGLSFPLMILGSAGEMHAYPVLCGIVILYCFVLERTNTDIRKMWIPIICIFLAFSISSYHKVLAIYDYSDRSMKLTENLHKVYDKSCKNSLFIVIGDWDGYSVFEQSAMSGIYNGYSIRPYYDWFEPDHKKYSAKTKEDADTYMKKHKDEFQQIFFVENETVTKVK